MLPTEFIDSCYKSLEVWCEFRALLISPLSGNGVGPNGSGELIGIQHLLPEILGAATAGDRNRAQEPVAVALHLCPSESPGGAVRVFGENMGRAPGVPEDLGLRAASARLGLGRHTGSHMQKHNDGEDLQPHFDASVHTNWRHPCCRGLCTSRLADTGTEAVFVNLAKARTQTSCRAAKADCPRQQLYSSSYLGST